MDEPNDAVIYVGRAVVNRPTNDGATTRYTVLVNGADLTAMTYASRVEWRGATWDVDTLPVEHGTGRHTGHVAFVIRNRPNPGNE